MLYLDGHKLLEDNDLPPQWNLLSGTSQSLETITIPKGQFYPGKYQQGNWGSPAFYNGLATYSAYIINKSDKYSITAEIDTTDNGPRYTNMIAPNSAGIIHASAKNIDAVFFKTNNTGDKVFVDKDVVFQVKEEKLERGSIVTPWMPAISDLMLKNQNGGGTATS